MELGGPFHKGRGGPGGWWIIDEPELHFVRNREVAVPDLAGWRRERMPRPPEDQRFEVVPDWVCEILSPSTRRKDRQDKMPLYACYGVWYAWLIDPVAHTLEVYRLESGAWIEVDRFADADQVAAPPFEAVSIDLEGLWLSQLVPTRRIPQPTPNDPGPYPDKPGTERAVTQHDTFSGRAEYRRIAQARRMWRTDGPLAGQPKDKSLESDRLRS